MCNCSLFTPKMPHFFSVFSRINFPILEGTNKRESPVNARDLTFIHCKFFAYRRIFYLDYLHWLYQVQVYIQQFQMNMELYLLKFNVSSVIRNDFEHLLFVGLVGDFIFKSKLMNPSGRNES